MTTVTIDARNRARCDQEGCEELAPDPGEYMISYNLDRWPGWNNIGWFCSGGKHLCPKHAPQP